MTDRRKSPLAGLAPLAPLASLALLLPALPADAAAQAYPFPAGYGAPIPPSFVLDSVTNGGRFVYLRGGSRWEVSFGDRPVADAWQPGQAIVIRSIPAPSGDFDTSFFNSDADRRAAVHFLGSGESTDATGSR